MSGVKDKFLRSKHTNEIWSFKNSKNNVKLKRCFIFLDICWENVWTCCLPNPHFCGNVYFWRRQWDSFNFKQVCITIFNRDPMYAGAVLGDEFFAIFRRSLISITELNTWIIIPWNILELYFVYVGQDFLLLLVNIRCIVIILPLSFSFPISDRGDAFTSLKKTFLVCKGK